MQRAKDDILRSASKKRNGTIGNVDYNNVEYVDPNYVKIEREEKPPRNYEAYNERRPKYESGPRRYVPRDYNEHLPDNSRDYPRDYNRDYPRDYNRDYPRDNGRSYLREPRVDQREDSSTFENRFTPKRNYEPIDPKYVSGRRNSPEKKFYYLDDQ